MGVDGYSEFIRSIGGYRKLARLLAPRISSVVLVAVASLMIFFYPDNDFSFSSPDGVPTESQVPATENTTSSAPPPTVMVPPTTVQQETPIQPDSLEDQGSSPDATQSNHYDTPLGGDVPQDTTSYYPGYPWGVRDAPPTTTPTDTTLDGTTAQSETRRDTTGDTAPQGTTTVENPWRMPEQPTATPTATAPVNPGMR